MPHLRIRVSSYVRIPCQLVLALRYITASMGQKYSVCNLAYWGGKIVYDYNLASKIKFGLMVLCFLQGKR